jgi:hypothetical protein
MKSRPILLLCLLFLQTPAGAQLSGFLSATRGYHNNPLYNFEGVGDQVLQSYAELTYTADDPGTRVKIGYVSGLMIFNAFTDRNYYEHTLTGSYAILPAPTADAAAAPAVELIGKLAARHDKQAFREFDNFGAGVVGSYRTSVGSGLELAVSDDVGYRAYRFLSPLSNITNQLTTELGTGGGLLRGGVRTGMGVKHFTETIYDTARFETRRTFVVKPGGHGKPGGDVIVPSDKQLLLNPETSTIVQWTAGLFGTLHLPHGMVEAEMLYRVNPGQPTRYLAQYANTSMLNEDIYNDHLSYEGPEVSITVRTALPGGLQATLTTTYQRKVFGAPALNLLGEEQGDHRTDYRPSAEIYLSRYVDLTDDLGLDIACSGTLLRNMSNDDYNDYSLFQAGLSLGFGF